MRPIVWFFMDIPKSNQRSNRQREEGNGRTALPIREPLDPLWSYASMVFAGASFNREVSVGVSIGLGLLMRTLSRHHRLVMPSRLVVRSGREFSPGHVPGFFLTRLDLKGSGETLSLCRQEPTVGRGSEGDF